MYLDAGKWLFGVTSMSSSKCCKTLLQRVSRVKQAVTGWWALKSPAERALKYFLNATGVEADLFVFRSAWDFPRCPAVVKSLWCKTRFRLKASLPEGETSILLFLSLTVQTHSLLSVYRLYNVRCTRRLKRSVGFLLTLYMS